MVHGFRFGPRVTWYYDCLCAAYQVSREVCGRNHREATSYFVGIRRISRNTTVIFQRRAVFARFRRFVTEDWQLAVFSVPQGCFFSLNENNIFNKSCSGFFVPTSQAPSVGTFLGLMCRLRFRRI